MVLKLNTFIKSEGFRIGKKKYNFMTEDEWQDLFAHIDELLKIKFSEDATRKLDIHSYQLFSKYGYGVSEFTWMNYYRTTHQRGKGVDFSQTLPYNPDNQEEARRFMSIIAREYRKAGWKVYHWRHDAFEVSIPSRKILLIELKEFLQQ